MRILAVANIIPMRDRSAGWFRFFHILRILANQHEVHLHPFDLAWQEKRYGKEETCGYRDTLTDLGIRITNGQWPELSRFLRQTAVDIAFFEHYTAAKGGILEQVRLWQPDAKVFIDTIDVSYRRLLSKANLTNKPEDVQLAVAVKAEELAIYSRSDLVIAISGAEKAMLEKDDPDVRIEVIPLVYTVRPLQGKEVGRRTLLFVADFEHEANVDGILYFCAEVLPLIQKVIPEICLRIVGHSPPSAVRELAGRGVELLGYVPDIGAVYASSDVAIAPMRFGGGLKGKVAEAMSYGLPVVTNHVCLEGFEGLLPGRDVLVGDDPEELAHAVAEVLRDDTLYQAVRENGWNYIRCRFSEEVVAKTLTGVLERSRQYPAKKLPMGKRAVWKARHLLERYLVWRFRHRAAI
jgi:glycosyltransferase involved in cell wall biosynthesis